MHYIHSQYINDWSSKYLQGAIAKDYQKQNDYNM